MEHNRVLMIVVAVGVFFAAVVGVGLTLLYPRGEGDAVVAGTSDVRDFDPIEYVRRPDAAPLTPAEEPDEPVVIVLGEDEGEELAEGEEPVVVGPAGEEPPALVERPAREERPAPAAAPEPASPGEPPATTERVAARTTEVEPPSPRAVRVTEYWIQLIASPSRDRIELARERLADHSLGGRVTTREVEGQIFYRLRVGPYANRDEADKFLEWIRDIDGFGEAWVSEEYPLRTVQG